MNMHKYRTHTCDSLRKSDLGRKVKLSGWVYRKREHKNVLFIDLRDHYGITQLVIDYELKHKFPSLEQAENSNKSQETELANLNISYESVITVVGSVIARSAETLNNKLNTGEIEVLVEDLIIESKAEPLPFSIDEENKEVFEELRLEYRFLDLRRNKLHKNILMRSEIIYEIRKKMIEAGFYEFQTPMLTASSPEGARDFIVPSRIHKGKFYALPQSPQLFKQLLMVSGFDKYFQIARCARDEDLRKDRSPEFDQLDIEMSFVTQEDIFQIAESLMHHIFTKFSSKKVNSIPFPRITYAESMLKYGNDKPDLRNPLLIHDLTEFFKSVNFKGFQEIIAQSGVIRAIVAPLPGNASRSFFDKLKDFVISEGAQGLGYLQLISNTEFKGPLDKFLTPENKIELLKLLNARPGIDTIFFVGDTKSQAEKISGKLRTKLGEELSLIPNDRYEFCWIVDYPFYELDEKTQKVAFSHNPFSMPQGGLEALNQAKNQEDLLQILAHQYDLVCNGLELSSGAIRNHKLDILYRAFEIVGYNKEEVDDKFRGMVKAFRYGPPPHGGIAPGIERIVMLLTDSANLREVIAFPFNQKAQDLLMGAPTNINLQHLKELGIILAKDS